jgi:hypothetical protein
MANSRTPRKLLLPATILLIASSLWMHASKRPITLEDIVDRRDIGEQEIAPDAKTIAVVIKGGYCWKQCFYTLSDIEKLVHRHGLRDYRVERMSFSRPEEIDHIGRVYGESVRGIPSERFVHDPLFEHLLIADR